MVSQRLDVNVYVHISVAQLANLVFQFTGLAMGLAQAQVLVHFQVQFNEKAAVLLRRMHIVNRQAHALCGSANGLEQVFAFGRAWFHMHHYVRRNNLADAFLDGLG